MKIDWELLFLTFLFNFFSSKKFEENVIKEKNEIKKK